MKKTIKSLVIITMLLSTVLLLAGCGNKSDKKDENKASTNAIVGAWKYEQGGYTYHFNEDGTGFYDVSGSQMEFTYKTEGNKIAITYKGNSAAFETEYEIKDDTLNIKDSFGRDTLYKKQ